MALPTVLISMVVVSLFAMTGLGFALQSQAGSRDNQDWNAALTAAQAGVEDYIANLNRNDNYAKATTEHCSNTALQVPGANGTGNNCPTWTSSTPVGWKPVSPANPAGPAYHYDIDTRRLDSEGVILVTSTGRSRGETRSLEVGVGRTGSSQFLYFTDREDADPDNRTAYPANNLQPATCNNYWYNTRSGCREITFIGGDRLDGLVHTNDAPLFTAVGSVKPAFPAGLTTSFPRCKNVVPTNPATYSECDRDRVGGNYGKPPAYAEPKQLADNSDAFANHPGCQYRGATRIKFLNNGTMEVWSKDTVSGTAACGGTSPNGAPVAVPTDRVIYVRDSASIRKCKSQEIGDGLPVGSYTGSTTASHTYDRNMDLPTYQCGKGNVYVEGPLRGRVTIAASENIVVTGDLVLAGGPSGTDMLGLVASNSVAVIHPRLDAWNKVNGTWRYDNNPQEAADWPRRHADPGTGGLNPATGIQIAASLQTLQHSFYVQSYDQGPVKGTLAVRGSIAQRWRGAVGQGNPPSNGYLKDYSYDRRLQYSSPPYFPQWVNAVWQSNFTGEVAPRYGSS